MFNGVVQFVDRFADRFVVSFADRFADRFDELYGCTMRVGGFLIF